MGKWWTHCWTRHSEEQEYNILSYEGIVLSSTWWRTYIFVKKSKILQCHKFLVFSLLRKPKIWVVQLLKFFTAWGNGGCKTAYQLYTCLIISAAPKEPWKWWFSECPECFLIEAPQTSLYASSIFGVPTMDCLWQSGKPNPSAWSNPSPDHFITGRRENGMWPLRFQLHH